MLFAVLHFVVGRIMPGNRMHLWHSNIKKSQPTKLPLKHTFHQHSHFSIEQTIPLADREVIQISCYPSCGKFAFFIENTQEMFSFWIDYLKVKVHLHCCKLSFFCSACNNYIQYSFWMRKINQMLRCMMLFAFKFQIHTFRMWWWKLIRLNFLRVELTLNIESVFKATKMFALAVIKVLIPWIGFFGMQIMFCCGCMVERILDAKFI